MTQKAKALIADLTDVKNGLLNEDVVPKRADKLSSTLLRSCHNGISGFIAELFAAFVEEKVSFECRQKGVSRLIGMLKVGRKQLFLYDREMKTYEGELLALLDFYVHFSYQRQGYGKKLFEFMLHYERIAAHDVAFDNPTGKTPSLSTLEADLKVTEPT